MTPETASGKTAEASHEPVAPGAQTIRVVALMEAASVTGPAKNVIEFARRAMERSCGGVRLELSIAAFVRGDERQNAFVAAARAAGVTVDVIHERFPFDLGVVPQLRKIVASRSADIIQTHAVKSHFLVWLTRLHRRHRWIAFHRGYTWQNLKVRAYNQLDRISLPAADQVMTVCEPFAADLQRIGVVREKIIVRHNMVRPFVTSTRDAVEELRKRWSIPADRVVLLSVGRLSPEKGHLDLLDALSRLRQMPAKRGFHLVLVGEGPLADAIRRKVEVLGLAPFVTLTGQQADVRPYYSLADVVVLPSHSEGSPNVLLEAMAAGIPTVATRVGGVPEIASNEKNALIVEKSQPQAMAQAIYRLIDDEDLRARLGRAGAECAAGFDPEHYCDFMIELHRRLAGQDR